MALILWSLHRRTKPHQALILLFYPLHGRRRRHGPRNPSCLVLETQALPDDVALGRVGRGHGINEDL